MRESHLFCPWGRVAKNTSNPKLGLVSLKLLENNLFSETEPQKNRENKKLEAELRKRFKAVITYVLTDSLSSHQLLLRGFLRGEIQASDLRRLTRLVVRGWVSALFSISPQSVFFFL